MRKPFILETLDHRLGYETHAAVKLLITKTHIRLGTETHTLHRYIRAVTTYLGVETLTRCMTLTLGVRRGVNGKALLDFWQVQ